MRFYGYSALHAWGRWVNISSVKNYDNLTVENWLSFVNSWVSVPWWRHQMEAFSALRPFVNSPVPGEFPVQRPVTRSFDVFFDLRLNKPLSKQSWGWWFETLSPPLWRHCNDCALQIRGIYLTMYSCIKWISKLPGSFEIRWVRQFLVNVFCRLIMWPVNIWNDHKAQK